VALSNDGGRTLGKAKVIADGPDGGFCYIAAEWVGERLLLGYCAHKSRWGLQTTPVTVVERGWVEK
jgi:hypothetical protein